MIGRNEMNIVETGDGPGRPDLDADIDRVLEAMREGGTAICPNTVGYGLWAASAEANRRVIEAKERGGHKRQALLCDHVGQREIHVLSRRRQDMIECLTRDFDLPLGIVAPYNPDHPLIKAVDPDTLMRGTAGGTIGMLMNAGPFHEAVGRFAREENHPIFGSSANVTGTGTRFRVEDIQPQILAVADVIIDYGLRRYHYYRRSSTIINFATMQVVRIGSCYDLISDALHRHFGLVLPPDPGRDANPSGHLDEYALPPVGD
jgi:tRNA A37 threonylcarbamoyladenosine synthetase subunit TsaC/SUA5/YrdC